MNPAEYLHLQDFLGIAATLLRSWGLRPTADAASFPGEERRAREEPNFCQPSVTSKNSTQIPQVQIPEGHHQAGSAVSGNWVDII